MRVVAFGDNNRPYHQFEAYGPRLRSFLESVDMEVDLTSDRTVFESGLSDYDVLVSVHPSPKTSEWTLTDAQLDGIESFIRSGNGYVPVHSAAAFELTESLPPDHERQARLLGGRMIGHPDQQDIEFDIRRPDHPVMDRVDPFVVFDEPYEVTIYDDVTVLATISCDGLNGAPACWVREEGAGRVCYLSLGHPPSTWEDPSFQRVLTNAVTWTAE